jgi:hypothetical protein
MTEPTVFCHFRKSSGVVLSKIIASIQVLDFLTSLRKVPFKSRAWDIILLRLKWQYNQSTGRVYYHRSTPLFTDAHIN